jgi:two-component system nitrogen regulation response regulator NtrX
MTRKNVLVVEDDGSIRDLLEAVLRRSGHTFAMAPDGSSALEQLRSAAFDVVLLDLLLPDVTGFDILREMKTTLAQMVPRTIVMTAAAETSLRNSDELDGTWCVLRKPLDIEDLVSEIDACRAQRQRGRKPPVGVEPVAAAQNRQTH